MRLTIYERPDVRKARLHGDEVRCGSCNEILEPDAKQCKACGRKFGGGAGLFSGMSADLPPLVPSVHLKHLKSEEIDKSFGSIVGCGPEADAERERRRVAYAKHRDQVLGIANVKKSNTATEAVVILVEALCKSGATHAEAHSFVSKRYPALYGRARVEGVVVA